MMTEQEKTAGIARVCHEANRAYCLFLGDASHACWDDAPQWQRDGAISVVLFHCANPEAGDSASHDNWLKDKERDGWRYGPMNNPKTKEHPRFVPFDQLPPEWQMKDRLFRSIVHALRG